MPANVMQDAIQVLLVEDNRGDARLVCEMLRSCADGAFEIECTASVHEALAALAPERRCAEVILLDLGLPDEQGLQTLRRVMAAACDIPIVVLTGQHDEDAARSAIKDGAQDFLNKGQLDGDRLRRVIEYAIERQKMHDQLQSSLEAKDVLLREVHHRVKNNLQVIQSLLRMQAASLQDEETREAVATMAQRVYAMARVHERLYQTSDVKDLPVESYLRDLFDGAVDSRSLEQGRIQLKLDAENVPLSLERAVPFGLLINELVCNSLKHGFRDGRAGTVEIEVHRKESGTHIAVKDDGIGLPPNFDATASPSMGLQVAAGLARQLGGKLAFTSENGCCVRSVLERI
jgi:two-component sensor histidine kinase/CheY-like chemotaxis protein